MPRTGIRQPPRTERIPQRHDDRKRPRSGQRLRRAGAFRRKPPEDAGNPRRPPALAATERAGAKRLGRSPGGDHLPGGNPAGRHGRGSAEHPGGGRRPRVRRHRRRLDSDEAYAQAGEPATAGQVQPRRKGAGFRGRGSRDRNGGPHRPLPPDGRAHGNAQRKAAGDRRRRPDALAEEPGGGTDTKPEKVPPQRVRP